MIWPAASPASPAVRRPVANGNGTLNMSNDPFHFLFNNGPRDTAKPERESAPPHQTNRSDPADCQLGQSLRVILSGQLIYADIELHHIDCVVLELHPGGARIETDQAINIPDYLFFGLGTAPIRPVRCIRQQGKSLELRYTDQFEALK